MTTSKNTLIKRAESKDTLKGFMLNKTNATVFPQFSFQRALAMMDSDPVANGAIQHFVDKCMEGDFVVLKRDTLDYDENFLNKLHRSYNFRTSILRKIFLLGKLFNNVFIEIVPNEDGSTKQLNILDSTNVEPITAPNGDLIKLQGVTRNPETGKVPEWTASEIVWIKFGDRTEGYAPVDMKALWETLLLKDYVRKYVSWLWQTGQYRTAFQFSQTTAEQDIETFLTFYRKAEADFTKPLLFKGEAEIKPTRDIKELDTIQNLLKYLDGQILINLRIPPIDAGIPDASGRSSADAQSNNLFTTVTSWKGIVEDAINNDLFIKMNHGNNILRFSPNDRFATKQVFEVLQIMSSLNFTQEAMEEYLLDCGMVFKQKTFNAPIVTPTLANPRKLDTMPSRAGKGTGEGNKPAASVTTRPDQLKKV